MAFNKTKLDPTGSGSRGNGAVGSYGDGTGDAKAAIKAVGYFNSVADELKDTRALVIFASDATFMAKVSIASGVVTLAAMDAF